MLDNQELPKKVKFVYKQPDDYKIVYANGIYGGPTPRGEFKFDLFHEYGPAPESELHYVKEDGSVGGKVESEASVEEAIVIRERKIGVVMELRHAKNIASWMLTKIQEIEERREELIEEEANEDA